MINVRRTIFATSAPERGFIEGKDFEELRNDTIYGLPCIVLTRKTFPEDDDRKSREIYIPLSQIKA